MRRNKRRGRAKRRRALSLHCLATRCSPSSERVRHCTATGVRPRAGEGQGCGLIQIPIFNGCFLTPTSFVPVRVGPIRRDCAKACRQTGVTRPERPDWLGLGDLNCCNASQHQLAIAHGA